MLSILPAFIEKDKIKDHEKYLNELNDKFYPNTNYWAKAVKIIKEKGRNLQIYHFLIELGLYKEGYSEQSLRHGSRIIKNRFKGLSFTELKELILDNKLPENLKSKKEKFEALINLEVRTPNYYSEAIRLLKSKPERYRYPETLVRDLGGLGFSEASIKKVANRCLKSKLGYDLAELKDIAWK